MDEQHQLRAEYFSATRKEISNVGSSYSTCNGDVDRFFDPACVEWGSVCTWQGFWLHPWRWVGGNSSGSRMLAEPASVTRDGITVTVTQALVYEDRVELTYTVKGITESYDSGNDMCGSIHPNNDFWSGGDADLRLPDGSVICRDYAGKYQSQNAFAMKPVYAISVPSNVTKMTMLLKCIPLTKLGTAPENGEVPFKLVAIPVFQRGVSSQWNDLEKRLSCS